MTVNTTAEATEEVDTSTNEEAQDTEAELEESDVSFDDAEDDSTDDETEESEESEDEQAATSSDDGTEEESAEDGDEEATEQRTDSEAERKRQNDEAAKRRIAEREAREQAKRESQEKYVSEAETNQELALRQLQVDAYNNKVLTNSNMLQNGIDKAVAHIDLFKTGTPEVKEALLDAVDDFEAMYVVKDRNGDPIEVKGDLFDYLQRKADSIKRLTGVGIRQAKQDKDKTKARTLSPPQRVPKKPKVDPDIEGFDEEAERW